MRSVAAVAALPGFATERSRQEFAMTDYVDIAIPANAMAAAEALGLKVQRSITNGTWIRHLSRDEAEIAIECLRDCGFTARMRDNASVDGAPAYGAAVEQHPRSR
jgi:hypothetical protein